MRMLLPAFQGVSRPEALAEPTEHMELGVLGVVETQDQGVFRGQYTNPSKRWDSCRGKNTHSGRLGKSSLPPELDSGLPETRSSIFLRPVLESF